MFRTVFDGWISFNDKPDRSICLYDVVNKHFEFACSFPKQTHPISARPGLHMSAIGSDREVQDLLRPDLELTVLSRFLRQYPEGTADLYLRPVLFILISSNSIASKFIMGNFLQLVSCLPIFPENDTGPIISLFKYSTKCLNGCSLK
ncbi:hypothetical protein AVEN_92523-1 [Araneus ventricosus]|uniref:Uncharacterized protein n=1 Tax=Araneus ventricosus TaxID=182803 RepID=A0A4Y2AI69_ARAVE|nr:hypothetical protein AVEN_92523-1 [Araneus ventricosus]